MKYKKIAYVLMIISVFIYSYSGIPKPDLGRERLVFYEELKKSGVINPTDLVLTHFSHIGNLNVEGEILYVLDVREIIPAMAAPRGLNKIVIFNRSFELLHVIRYVDERPLRCDGNALLLFGYLDIQLAGGAEGNLLIFSNKGKAISVDRIEWNELLPDTRLDKIREESKAK